MGNSKKFKTRFHGFKVLQLKTTKFSIKVCNPENMWPRFSPAGSRVGFSVQGDRERGDIVTDISTSFVILIGILFPSFTGYN